MTTWVSAWVCVYVDVIVYYKICIIYPCLLFHLGWYFWFFRQRFSLSDSCLNLHTCKEHKYPSDRLVIVQRIQNHFGALNKCTFQSPSIRTCDMRMYRWMHFEHKVHMWLSSCGQRVNQSCPVLSRPAQSSPIYCRQSVIHATVEYMYIHICIHACPMDLWCQCIALCRCLCFVIREWDELHPIQISWNICCVHTLACATDCNRGYGLQKVLSESCWLRARGVGGHELYYVMDYKSASAATTFLLIGGSIMWALIVVIFVAESYLFLCGDLK